MNASYIRKMSGNGEGFSVGRIVQGCIIGALGILAGILFSGGKMATVASELAEQKTAIAVQGQRVTGLELDIRDIKEDVEKIDGKIDELLRRP